MAFVCLGKSAGILPASFTHTKPLMAFVCLGRTWERMLSSCSSVPMSGGRWVR